jgi:DNA polymerase III epsilon subunit-like protein
MTAATEMPRLVFVDVEATGLDVAVHELLSLGYVVRDPGGTRVEIERYFEPEHVETAHPDAMRIIDYDRRIAPMPKAPLRASLEEFCEYAAGATLVGSNPSFDERMIMAALTRLDLPTEVWHHRKVDIAAMSYDGVGRPQGMSGLCKRFGVPLTDQHGALADALTTERLFDEIVRYRRLVAERAGIELQGTIEPPAEVDPRSPEAAPRSSA